MAELKQHLSDLGTPLVTGGSAKMGVEEFEENAKIMEGPKAEIFSIGSYAKEKQKDEVVGLSAAHNDKPEMPMGLSAGGMKKDIVGLGKYNRSTPEAVQYYVENPRLPVQQAQPIAAGPAPERKGLMEMTPEELQARFANVQKLAEKGAGIVGKGAEALGALKEARQKKVLREVLGHEHVDVVKPKGPSFWESILPKKKETPKVLEEMGIESV